MYLLYIVIVLYDYQYIKPTESTCTQYASLQNGALRYIFSKPGRPVMQVKEVPFYFTGLRHSHINLFIIANTLRRPVRTSSLIAIGSSTILSIHARACFCGGGFMWIWLRSSQSTSGRWIGSGSKVDYHRKCSNHMVITLVDWRTCL